MGGAAGQPDYFNGCYELETDLPPAELLTLCLSVEESLGRQRSGHWEARSIDLDLLLAGDQLMFGSQLTLPHPRLHYRWFALAPLADLNPRQVHPLLGRSVAELLALVEAPDLALAVVGGSRATLSELRQRFSGDRPCGRVIHCPAESVAMSMVQAGDRVIAVQWPQGHLDHHRLDPQVTWTVLAHTPNASCSCNARNRDRRDAGNGTAEPPVRQLLHSRSASFSTLYCRERRCPARKASAFSSVTAATATKKR